MHCLLQAPLLMPEISTFDSNAFFLPVVAAKVAQRIPRLSHWLCQSWPDSNSQGCFRRACWQHPLPSSRISRQKCQNEVTLPVTSVIANVM
jgi:hypothetical protein